MPENLGDSGGVILKIWVAPELVAIGVAPDIQRFVDAMLYKLRRNHHKGNWDELPLATAWKDLGAEVAELKKAIKHGSSAEILFEGADVANEALIVANIALQGRINSPARSDQTRRAKVDGALRPDAIEHAAGGKGNGGAHPRK